MSVQVVRNIQAEKELKSFFEKIEAEAGYFSGAVEAGYFGGAEEDGQSIADIAAKNEATRPFMSRAGEEAAKEIPKFYQIEAKKPGYDAKTIFGKIGLYMVSLIKQQIDTAESWAKPNSAYTISLKGSSHPLVDTGTMRNNTDYRVK